MRAVGRTGASCLTGLGRGIGPWRWLSHDGRDGGQRGCAEPMQHVCYTTAALTPQLGGRASSQPSFDSVELLLEFVWILRSCMLCEGWSSTRWRGKVLLLASPCPSMLTSALALTLWQPGFALSLQTLRTSTSSSSSCQAAISAQNRHLCLTSLSGMISLAVSGSPEIGSFISGSTICRTHSIVTTRPLHQSP